MISEIRWVFIVEKRRQQYCWGSVERTAVLDMYRTAGLVVCCGGGGSKRG